MIYHPRVLETKLQEYLNFFSIVGLTGPRQSGKSTLLLNVLKDHYTYVSFDDQRIQDLLYHDPVGFMELYPDRVIFDEIQKAPELFNLIKIAVDNDRDKAGKFVLTGSSQFGFIRGVSESLAGRIGLLSLLPYQYSELDEGLHQESIYRGAYPELVNKKYQLHQDWFSAYLNTYLNNDVRSISNIGDMRDFQRLMHLLAANTSQQLNMSNYAKDLGVDVKTIKHWISILEASYIIYLLPPYHKNFGKRIIKSPKIYFYDTGLVSYLTGIETYKQFAQGPLSGAIFENYIIAEVIKRELHCKSHANLYYLRTSNGQEVDLVIDRKQYKELIEIKLSSTFRTKMIKHLDDFIEENDKAYLIYMGDSFPPMKKISVTNYKQYLQGQS